MLALFRNENPKEMKEDNMVQWNMLLLSFAS